MKQDDVLTLTIRDVGVEGEGIAQYQDYTVFVPFALPGEEVEVKVGYVKRNLAYATLLRVIVPSVHRTRPVCLRYEKCGSCDLMHADYPFQLEAKTKWVATTLHKAKVDAEVLPCVPSPRRLAYRNKIMLPFGMVDNRPVLGFYREGTHRVVSIKHCPLHNGWVDTLIAVTLDFANKWGLSVYDGTIGRGLLRHLVARRMGDHVDVTLVVNARNLPHYDSYAEALSQSFDSFALYVSPNVRRNNVILGDTVSLLAGRAYEHTVGGVRVEVNPLSFLQVNDDVCAAIYDRVDRLIAPTEGKTVVDAFAGVGILGAGFARKGATQYNIEIVPEAVVDANRLAVRNGVQDKVTNLLGDSAVQLPHLLEALRQSLPKVHDMHLHASYFEAIASGSKRYELRLADTKRRSVNVGDLICFTCSDRRLYCRVTRCSTYPDFHALFAALGTEHTVGETVSPDQAADSMLSIYSKEQISAYGAMAIGILPVNAEGVSVVLDPPRKGCPTSVVDSLTGLAAYAPSGTAVCNPDWPWVTLPYVQRIVYVSCNPATLARDLATLQTAYDIAEVQPYDMFPQTRHVETLVLLNGRVDN